MEYAEALKLAIDSFRDENYTYSPGDIEYRADSFMDAEARYKNRNAHACAYREAWESLSEYLAQVCDIHATGNFQAPESRGRGSAFGDVAELVAELSPKEAN